MQVRAGPSQKKRKMPSALSSSPEPSSPSLPQEEKPLYILSQEKKRILLPQILTLLLLGFILYLGVLLNLSLLELSSPTQDLIKTITLITVFFLILLGLFLNFLKAKQKYFFYPNRITFKRKTLLLSEITSLKLKQNFLDKIFKTYSIVLNQKFKIENIPQNIQLRDYVQKLIDYSRQVSYPKQTQ